MRFEKKRKTAPKNSDSSLSKMEQLMNAKPDDLFGDDDSLFENDFSMEGAIGGIEPDNCCTKKKKDPF